MSGAGGRRYTLEITGTGGITTIKDGRLTMAKRKAQATFDERLVEDEAFEEEL